MFKVILIMIAGMVIGYLLRNQTKIIRRFNKSALYIIFLLLFFMGVAVGHNREIMDNLGTIGLTGLLLAIFSLMGSVVMAWGVYHIWFKSK